MRVRKEFHFDAAHRLINVGPQKCRNLHGHTYRVEVEVAGPINNSMVIDFTDLKTIVNDAVIDRWDHQFINDLVPEGLETTVENLVSLAVEMIQSKLPSGVELARLVMYEGLNNSAVWEK